MPDPEKRFKNTPGSVTKYDDPEVQKIILDALEDGNHLYVAARLAGVHADTLHDWIRRGHLRENASPGLIEFVEKIDLAMAKWEAGAVAVIHKTALSGRPNTWQAAMTMLERKFPDRWGRRETVEVDAEKPLVQINHLVLEDPEVRAASREFLRRVAGSPLLLERGRSELTDPENDNTEGAM
jgi:transposase